MLLHISLIASALSALALASPHAAPAQLAQRDFASCQQDGLVACCLYASPSLASPYCSSVLATSTVTAPVVTLSTNVTSTVFVTLKDNYTIPITTTSTTVVTTTGTLTITVVSTSATTTTTTTTTTATATATTGAISVDKKARRDAAPSPPPCVTQGTSYPASRITFACSCLYTQPTITVTPGAATKTVTLLSTTSPVVTMTVSSTTTVPFTITTTSSTTTQTTTTTATTAVFTNIAFPGYTLAVGAVYGQNCLYNFFASSASTGDLGPNIISYIDYCRNACTNDLTCQFFFLATSTVNIGPEPLCELSLTPYIPQELVCNGMDGTAYYVGYNKVM